MTARPLRALAVLVGLTGSVAAGPLDALLEPYLAAARAGRLGVVAGQALEEGRRPGDPPTPLEGLAVTLVPRSESLLQQFEQIKREARASEKVYRRSAPALVDARRAWERALSEAGAGELVRFRAADPDGTFEVERVPAGQWLLVAERSVFVSRPSPEPGKRDKGIFVPSPRLVGYSTVTVWLRELTIEPGRTERVELHDRNAWMRAIREERRDAGP